MLTVMATQPTLFEDTPVLANAIRLFIIFMGFTVALIAAKIALRAFRFLDWERAFGTLASGLFIVTPSITGLYRFDDPLQAYTTITYFVGLLCAIVALWFRFTLNWKWLHALIERHRERRGTPAAR